jgi:putative DNA primase/helicase
MSALPTPFVVDSNPELAFQSAIAAAGLTPPDIVIADGKIHRFTTNSKRSDDAGWYILHLDNIPAGSFGNWREGRTESWCSVKPNARTTEQKMQYATLLKSMQNARHRAKGADHDAAAEMATAIWRLATPIYDAPTHVYLVKKGTQAHGAKIIDTDVAWAQCGRLSTVLSGPLLVIPMRNAAGELRSLQFITADGTKRPLTGGEKQRCHYRIDEPDSAAHIAILIVCEGFATGASIHEATGHAVAVAFDKGNLEPVAKSLRKLYPDAALLIAADDDHQTEGNPGRTAAASAAKAVGGVMVVPMFPADRPDKATDFNDLYQLAGGGLDAVKSCFAGAIDSILGCAGVTEAGGQIDTKSTQVGTQSGTQDGTQVKATMIEPDPVQAVDTVQDATEHSEATVTSAPTEGSEAPALPASQFPAMDGRPRYVVLDDWTKSVDGNHRPGVYYCGLTAGKTNLPPEPFDAWICSPMHIDAVTFDGQSNNFGRLLRFKPTVGKWREWAMPMELLAGDGAQLRGELLAMGVELDPYKARQQLPHYLQSEHPMRRIHCALQVGWCGDSFVLPDVVIGPKSAGVIFQSGERGHEEHTQAGTLAGWKDGIAAKAVGNPLLMLAVSASFAGPLLARCNSEGGGFHVVGESSTGKTTMIEGACATWGGPGFKRSWRATANGMEGAAAMFNDCLLALDEISECDPKEVGSIVYALGNGRGKQRASRSGNARGVTRWCCFVISSGERSIATTMQEGGHRAKAGQSMRLLDIPAAQAYGAWDALHGATSPAAFSDAIKRVAAQHHGHAGRAFLEKLTFDTTDYCSELDKIKALPLFATDGTEGQDKRAAARFALIGLAGELATQYGVTGWPVGDAIEAAAQTFKLWQAGRGKGNDEPRQIADKVRGFIERHGDARFSNADYTGDTPVVRDRAGWWRSNSVGREYLFTAEAMHEALKGFDFKRALDVLQELGALPAPGSDGKRARFNRIGGLGVKLYPLNPEKLEGRDHGA